MSFLTRNPYQPIVTTQVVRSQNSGVRMRDPAKTFEDLVVTNEEGDVPVVITVYRTSKIEKYWRKP